MEIDVDVIIVGVRRERIQSGAFPLSRVQAGADSPLIFAVVAKITLGKFETSFSRLAKQRSNRCFDAASLRRTQPIEGCQASEPKSHPAKTHVPGVANRSPLDVRRLERSP
jgi:hypothetical protein